MTITASQFFNNEQVVVWHGDTLTVEDAWVEGSGYNASFNKSLFENHAKMIWNRMLGVPSIGTGHQRWIDNYGEVNAHNCRFGGENGGMTVAASACRGRPEAAATNWMHRLRLRQRQHQRLMTVLQ